jgi:hypothetical protein
MSSVGVSMRGGTVNNFLLQKEKEVAGKQIAVGKIEGTT